MRAEDVAKELRRTVDFINKERALYYQRDKKKDLDDWIIRLHNSAFWNEIQSGLIGDEVAYFESAWSSYSDQFGSASDVLPTDDLMIRDLILLDIFANRCVAEKASVLRRLSTLHTLIEKEREKPASARDTESLASWRSQVDSLYAAKNALTKEHIEYQTKKDVKLRDLKGSREQRFKQIEESKRNIFELIKELTTQKKRVEEGRFVEKMRLATERVRQDWNHDMEFVDGSGVYDRPFVSPEGEMEDEEASPPTFPAHKQFTQEDDEDE